MRDAKEKTVIVIIYSYYRLLKNKISAFYNYFLLLLSEYNQKLTVNNTEEALVNNEIQRIVWQGWPHNEKIEVVLLNPNQL